MYAIRSYYVNLNRHPAYGGFRNLRARLRVAGEPLDPLLLAAGLGGYSEEGRTYIQKIRELIRNNRLTDFDLARLADIKA